MGTKKHTTSAPPHGTPFPVGEEAVAVDNFRAALLAWYDKYRRTLPWRAAQGQAEPYHVWLSEIMLQQTVVAAVIPYFQKFVDKWPTVADLAAASQEEVMQAWAGLGYYARARNLHKCAQVVAAEYGGRFPDTQDGLMALAGVGEYTSAAITAIAFNKPAVVIDGNVDRVVARWFAVEDPFPAGKKQVRHYAGLLSAGRTDRPGDFAQAMMDLGATVCIPKAARCGLCPVADGCRGREMGIQDELPRKAPPKAKPQKRGFVYGVTDKRGRVLLMRRDERAMMGGMMALPVSEWVEKGQKPAHDPVMEAVSSIAVKRGLVVRHSFTHFDLELQGCVLTDVDARSFRGAAYKWVAPEEAAEAGLPSLFMKALRLFFTS